MELLLRFGAQSEGAKYMACAKYASHAYHELPVTNATFFRHVWEDICHVEKFDWQYQEDLSFSPHHSNTSHFNAGWIASGRPE